MTGKVLRRRVAAADDDDVIFIAIQGLSQGIIGRAVDGTTRAAQ